MKQYAINEQIYFDMEIIRARFLWRKDRRAQRKAFDRAMRKFSKSIERDMLHEIGRTFKRCGRGRP